MPAKIIRSLVSLPDRVRPPARYATTGGQFKMPMTVVGAGGTAPNQALGAEHSQPFHAFFSAAPKSQERRPRARPPPRPGPRPAAPPRRVRGRSRGAAATRRTNRPRRPVDGRRYVMGIPGLKICTAATPEGAYGLCKAMIRDDGPGILFTPVKLMKDEKVPVDVGTCLQLNKAHLMRTASDASVAAGTAVTVLTYDRRRPRTRPRPRPPRPDAADAPRGSRGAAATRPTAGTSTAFGRASTPSRRSRPRDTTSTSSSCGR